MVGDLSRRLDGNYFNLGRVLDSEAWDPSGLPTDIAGLIVAHTSYRPEDLAFRGVPGTEEVLDLILRTGTDRTREGHSAAAKRELEYNGSIVNTILDALGRTDPGYVWAFSFQDFKGSKKYRELFGDFLWILESFSYATPTEEFPGDFSLVVAYDVSRLTPGAEKSRFRLPSNPLDAFVGAFRFSRLNDNNIPEDFMRLTEQD